MWHLPTLFGETDVSGNCGVVSVVVGNVIKTGSEKKNTIFIILKKHHENSIKADSLRYLSTCVILHDLRWHI